MPSEKPSQKLEILFSVLVVMILLEVAHFAVISSQSNYIINNALIFGTVGSNNWAIAISAIFIIIALFYVKKRHISPLALIFFFSGAATNLLDRYLHDGSVDYLRLSDWPVFNLPDVLIISGLAIFLIEFLFFKNSNR